MIHTFGARQGLKLPANASGLSLQQILVKGYKVYLFQLQGLSIVAYCYFRHVVSMLLVRGCVPAVFVECGSHYACFLSGIEPRFSVTHYKHGRHITYHFNWADILEIFFWCVRPCAQHSYPEHQWESFCLTNSNTVCFYLIVWTMSKNNLCSAFSCFCPTIFICLSFYFNCERS